MENVFYVNSKDNMEIIAVDLDKINELAMFAVVLGRKHIEFFANLDCVASLSDYAKENDDQYSQLYRLLEADRKNGIKMLNIATLVALLKDDKDNKKDYLRALEFYKHEVAYNNKKYGEKTVCFDEKWLSRITFNCPDSNKKDDSELSLLLSKE